MTLPRRLDDRLWVIDHPLVMPGGIALGTRTTLVRFADGRLWMHSPGPLDEGLRGWLEEHGPVAAIVAPSLLHHFHAQENVQAFPEAEVYGPPGFSQKTGIDVEALDGAPWPWVGELDGLLVGGCPKMNELVFRHDPSGTLILTDLAFNFREASGFGTRMFLRINGALGRFGPSRLGRRVFFGDLDEVRRAVVRILEWDFDRVIVAHGQVLEKGGPEAMRQGFAWLLD